MSFRVHKDVPVTMRDGVTLATDLWVPEETPAPTLLVRMPYGKDVFPGVYGVTLGPNLFALLEAGYAVVYQDCRGTYRSDGVFTPHRNDPHDGADTVAWLREQPWCDGAVGAFGASYLGFVQWAAASQTPEGLRAIIPTLTTTDYHRTPWYSSGGALSWHTTWFWTTMMTLTAEQNALTAGSGDPSVLSGLADMMGDPRPHLDALPISDQPLLDARSPWWSDFLAHPDRDRFWADLAIVDRLGKVTTPALNIGGWFDLFVESTVRSYTRMRAEGGSEEARTGQRLIIGPWDHLSYDGVYADRQFGLAASAGAADVHGAHVQFFDRWLRGRTDALDGTAPVRIFVMGIDQWRDEQDWPLPDTEYTDFYLQRADTTAERVLATRPPSVETSDAYDFDPANPVPTLGGRIMLPAALNAAGPVDQRPVESRDDVLCFTSPVLEAPVEVTGHVSLVLHVTSSSRDTDFTGKLVDVFPDGRAIYLTDGILRTRYRNSLAEPTLLEPGQLSEITVDLSVTSNVFLAGHRIRLEVSSSNFPRYDRNTNTGGVIAEDTAEDALVATNRILYGPEHPSRLVLPVVHR